MSHPFHYLLRGVRAAELAPGNLFAADVLRKHGLGHLSESLRHAPGDAAVFDLPAGVMFTPTVRGETPAVINWNAKSQEWLECSPQLMIGWERDDLPTPQVLERAQTLGGIPLEDDVGQHWIIPIARSPKQQRSTLTSDFELDIATGMPTAVRKACWDWLWELSGQLWDYWNKPADARPAEHDESWMIRSAVRILQANYVIGPPEINAFRKMGRSVLDQPKSAAITLALIDFDFVKELSAEASNDPSKKNEAEAPAS